jgi:hypothetical protein
MAHLFCFSRHVGNPLFVAFTFIYARGNYVTNTS